MTREQAEERLAELGFVRSSPMALNPLMRAEDGAMANLVLVEADPAAFKIAIFLPSVVEE